MRYHKITSPDIENGLGCRVTLWVAGCTHHCEGCHNPETWDFNSGKPFDEAAKEELFSRLSLDYIKGITFSGGDPVDSYDDVLALMKEIKEKFPDKDIWLYTGYDFNALIRSDRVEMLSYVDYLVDGEYKESQRDIAIAFRGSRNQHIYKFYADHNEMMDVSEMIDK